jgi:micrococcal nuclease
MKRTCLFVIPLLLCLYLYAGATSLIASVVGVQDGRTITVMTAGRPAVVVLEGVDTPDEDQPFGAIARQHLSDLVMGKQVTIEFTGLASGNYLIARVITNNIDIGQQMIRDGAARYSPQYDKNLSDEDRRLYTESEAAARSEQRGIWQANSMVPRGEWTHAKGIGRDSAVQTVAQPAPTPPQTVDYVSTRATPSVNTQPAISAAPATSSEFQWPMFSPSAAPFSLRIPNGGKAFSGAIELPGGEKVTANFYSVQHLKIEYIAVWATGPYAHKSVTTGFERTLSGITDALQSHGVPCEFKASSDAPLKGYKGRQYKIDGCAFYGGIRFYYKVEGKEIRVYMVGVVTEEPDNPQVKQFLGSLVIDR